MPVINIRHAPPGAEYVYIGRRGRGHDGYFGNPYAVGHWCARCRRPHPTAGETLPCYEAYFLERLDEDPEFRRRVLELKGKTLGCFCAPGPCHGDVILAWLEKQGDPP